MPAATAAVRFEPFLHLVEVTHDKALLAWGGFYFRRHDPHGQWQLVSDEELTEVDPGRTSSIGANAQPYGRAVVEVHDDQQRVVSHQVVEESNYVWIDGLAADRHYSYQVVVNGQPWADGERWDWGPVSRGGLDLAPQGRHYMRRFRTDPHPGTSAPLTFAVIGDYGVGVRQDTESGRRQRRIAATLDAVVAEQGARLVLTVGDNVYQGGGQDADWYASFYAPYRYLLAQVPVYPAVGNHDTGETESSDEREQIIDNFHINTRFAALEDGARSLVEPGLAYRFGYGADIEFCCIDTSQVVGRPEEHLFSHPDHAAFLADTFAPDRLQGRWLIPFGHHPPYCAGPDHANTEAMLDTLVPLFQQAEVRLVLSGHEHNFQVSRAEQVTYVLTGAGAKLNEEPPTSFEQARTEAWAAQAHCLLVEVSETELTVTPVSGVDSRHGVQAMSAQAPDGALVRPPFRVHRGPPLPPTVDPTTRAGATEWR